MTHFQSQACGKWILAGEHAVVRGGPALVFPVVSRSASLRFTPFSQELTAKFIGAHGEDFRMLFWGVFDRALELLRKNRSEIQGEFEFYNDIPVGAGMGASATLCANVVQWLQWKGWLNSSQLYDFARELENIFHGESSGVDVAVALSGKGLYFKRDGTREPIHQAWQPYWYLSYSGKRGLTSDCVLKVKSLYQREPALGLSLDEKMTEATERARQALAKNSEQGLLDLRQAIRSARECFEHWGLVCPELQTHMEVLKSKGALETKPTGSGDGGFVLSLWSHPVTFMEFEMIPLFKESKININL